MSQCLAPLLPSLPLLCLPSSLSACVAQEFGDWQLKFSVSFYKISVVSNKKCPFKLFSIVQLHKITMFSQLRHKGHILQRRRHGVDQDGGIFLSYPSALPGVVG